jgi:hypothetical protein
MTDDRDRDPLTEELSTEERALLERWLAPPPPAGFAARTTTAAATAMTTGTGPGPVRRRWAWLGAGVAVAAVAAAGVAALAVPRGGARLGATVGVIDSGGARRSVPVGERAVAVLEPGAALAYAAAAGDGFVEQRAGSVFYRVEPGRRFAVATPAGLVEVTGTCFRVEVQDMSRRRMIVSGAVGAAVAAAAVVTVYEGKLRVVPTHAAPVEVGPGQAVTVGADGASVARGPAPAGEVAPGAAELVAIADDPSVAALSQAQLIARDRAQREQIAALGQRVRDLEANARSGRGPGLEGDYVEPSKEELLAWAKDCTVKIDFPPLMSPRPFALGDDAIKAVGLNDGEVATANAVLARLKTDWAGRVRGWYLEATGDTGGADALSVEAMARELTDKAAPGEPAALQKRLAEERAGLVPPPADLSSASPFERFFRAFADLGNEAERMLAAAIGRQSAHGVRTHDGGWPARMSMSGCDDGGP